MSYILLFVQKKAQEKLGFGSWALGFYSVCHPCSTLTCGKGLWD